jgi:hypothetical protein
MEALGPRWSLLLRRGCRDSFRCVERPRIGVCASKDWSPVDGSSYTPANITDVVLRQLRCPQRWHRDAMSHSSRCHTRHCHATDLVNKCETSVNLCPTVTAWVYLTCGPSHQNAARLPDSGSTLHKHVSYAPTPLYVSLGCSRTFDREHTHENMLRLSSQDDS